MRPKLASKSLSRLLVDIDSLVPMKGNPRIGNVEMIAESLARFGQVKPIHVRVSDRQILAGNHTWQAARHLGWEQIAATFDDIDDEDAIAFALADNRTSDLGIYDESALAAMLAEIEDLAGTGYDLSDVQALLDQTAEDDKITFQDSTREIDPDEWAVSHTCAECGFTW